MKLDIDIVPFIPTHYSYTGPAANNYTWHEAYSHTMKPGYRIATRMDARGGKANHHWLFSPRRSEQAGRTRRPTT